MLMIFRISVLYYAYNVLKTIKYTSVNYNTKGTRHFVRISESSKFRKFKKIKNFDNA